MFPHDAQPSAAAETPWPVAPVPAATAADRLHFVPLDVLGEPAPDPAPTLIRIQKAGWSVREQGAGRRTRAAADPVVVAVLEEAAATPRTPGLILLVAVVTVLLVLALCSTALLRHLV
jgi:hypothetical protein